MTDKHVWADEIAGELERARLHLMTALADADRYGFKGYKKPIQKLIDGAKAVEWPLRGRHPDELAPTVMRPEPFVVKDYAGGDGPEVKGNGFDGLRIGETRDEAQAFVDWVNARLWATR